MGSSLSAVLCPFVALVYPAYASYKAVESPQPEDDTQWLTYWIITAIFHVIELFGDRLVFWMPLYYEFKLVTLLILQNSKWRVPCFIYSKMVRPFLKPREESIDAWLDRSYLNILTSVSSGLTYLVHNGPTFMAAFADTLNQATENARKAVADNEAKQHEQHHQQAHHQKTQ